MGLFSRNKEQEIEKTQESEESDEEEFSEVTYTVDGSDYTINYDEVDSLSITFNDLVKSMKDKTVYKITDDEYVDGAKISRIYIS
jgi:hypothetical protein